MSKRGLACDDDGTTIRKSKESRHNAWEDSPTNGSERVLRNEDYTVGWICAITTEYVAAQAFLDKMHEGPKFLSLNDNNDYALGKVGKHNVVIAVLPDGEYGISSAASVASDMRHSFPNVRIGLMVGIGGGAPSQKHDIRLGDIVVSAPRNGNGGVFQYDFGKTIQDQSFRPTGFLNQPPIALRTAVSGLRAQYELYGHQLKETIDSILEKKPRLRKKYQRPGPSSDRLYQTKTIHSLNDERSCKTVCGDDPSDLIPRRERTEDKDNPAIHYGLIASANQLMKDAVVRDTLAAENDVLCFEMEAAGLINHFPCLVIRGICDYSDSHKNKEWQGYAAMAAAAYTKDLLYRISPNKVEAENRISDLLSNVLDTVSRTGANVETMRSKLDRNEHLEILNWLTPIDYSPLQSDFMMKRHEGTGTWLLHTEEFKTWLQKRGKTLFCPGIPGAGKTILAAIVVDHLYDQFAGYPTHVFAYVYCSFQRQHEQKPEDLLLSLLKQFVQKQLPPHKSVNALYERYNRKPTRPSLSEIEAVLCTLTANYSRAFIVVDALDECGVSEGGRQEFLSSIFKLQAKTGVNFFATSRVIDDVAKLFNGALSVQIRATNEDIKRYVDGQMPRLRSEILDDELRGMVKREVIKAVDGMFLLAQLHMDTLADKPTKGHIKQALKNLAQGIDGLDKTYDQAMERIKDQGSSGELAKHILAWIINAKRPLSTTELQHALACAPGTVTLDLDYLPSDQLLRSVCAGLVIVDEQSGIMRIVHYTAQEYFDRNQGLWFPDANIYIAKICVAYLSLDAFESGLCKTDKEFEERLWSYALYDYAARNWGIHARGDSIQVDWVVVNFLKSEAKVAASCQAMMVSQGYRSNGYSQMVPGQMKGVHVAAYFGLGDTLSALLEGGYSLDSKDTEGRTPLLLAAKNGHETVIRLLLAKDGIDLNSNDKGGLTPLSWAVKNRHETVVRLLLAKDGVDPNSKDSELSPLWWAIQGGREELIQTLLANACVDLDSKNPLGQTPLSWAAEFGRKVSVELLLGKDRVNPNSKDTFYGQTPLSWAAEHGHKAVVELLLAKDNVNPNSKDKKGRTSLWWAIKHGHKAIVELLLAGSGVNPDFKDNDGRTSLSFAAEKGYEAIVRILLANGGVDPGSRDKYNWTPLLRAAVNGHEAVVELLLANVSVNPDSKDNNGRGPLSWAAGSGWEAVVKLLLTKGGVDPDSKCRSGRTALSFAAKNGHNAVVMLLLAAERVNMESRDNMERTPLWWAARNGHEVVVKLLLDRGTDPDSKDARGWTPLSCAAAYGHKTVVKLLQSH